MGTKSQRIEMMEKALLETKESLDKIQETTSVNLKQALSSFEEERKMLTKKIESQSQEASQKDLLIFQIKQELEHSTANKDRKIGELEYLASEREKEVHKLKEAFEGTCSKLQGQSDDFLEKENKMSKDLALSNQKVDPPKDRTSSTSKGLTNLTTSWSPPASRLTRSWLPRGKKSLKK
jgi:uncharacterized protein YoxC